MADFGVVVDKLQSFETADDLADFFRGYGIIAQPRNSRACAISKFVTEETGLEGVATSMGSLTVYEDEEETIQTEHVTHTDAMRDFVDRYDKGYYPDLIEAGYEIAFNPNYGMCDCEACV
jgi:hypothetical protein